MSASRTLALDMGNTNTAVALFEGRRILRRSSAPTVEGPGALRLAGLARMRPSGAIACSVVPRREAALAAEVRRATGLGLLFLEKDFRTPLEVRQERRGAVGADRLAAAYGALGIHPGGAVVVDFGSAVTVDIVTPDGVYHGGSIGPGVSTSLVALHERCARLPAVRAARPRRALGRSTAPAMLSGCVIGAAGAADRLIDGMLRELRLELPVVATGGDAGLVAPFSRRIGSVRPGLTLEGLARAFWDSCR